MWTQALEWHWILSQCGACSGYLIRLFAFLFSITKLLFPCQHIANDYSILRDEWRRWRWKVPTSMSVPPPFRHPEEDASHLRRVTSSEVSSWPTRKQWVSRDAEMYFKCRVFSRGIPFSFETREDIVHPFQSQGSLWWGFDEGNIRPASPSARSTSTTDFQMLEMG